MKPFCNAVVPIALAIQYVGPRVVSVLAVAIEEADNFYVYVSSCYFLKEQMIQELTK